MVGVRKFVALAVISKGTPKVFHTSTGFCPSIIKGVQRLVTLPVIMIVRVTGASLRA